MDSTVQVHGTESAFEVKGVIKEAWAIAKKYWISFLALAGIAIAVSIAAGIVTGIIGVVLGFIFSRAPAILGLWQFISTVVRYAAEVPVMIAMIRLGFVAVDGGAVDYKKLFEYKDFWLALFFVGATILSAIIIGFGTLFFIVPGILAAIVFAFTQYVTVDKGVNPIESLQISYALTENNRLNIFLLSLVTGLLALLTMLPLFLMGGLAFILLLVGGSDGDMEFMIPLAAVVGVVAVIAGGPIAIVGGFIVGMIKQISMARVYRVLAAKNHAAFNVNKAA